MSLYTRLEETIQSQIKPISNLDVNLLNDEPWSSIKERSPRLLPNLPTIPWVSTKSLQDFNLQPRSWSILLNNPSIPNWSENLGFYFENLQTKIKPKSQSQLTTIDVIPKTWTTNSNQINRVTMVRVIKIEEDEWWRLDVFLSKNTQWLTYRFSLILSRIVFL
jgi:hypothetical protein